MPGQKDGKSAVGVFITYWRNITYFKRDRIVCIDCDDVSENFPQSILVHSFPSQKEINVGGVAVLYAEQCSEIETALENKLVGVC